MNNSIARKQLEKKAIKIIENADQKTFWRIIKEVCDESCLIDTIEGNMLNWKTKDIEKFIKKFSTNKKQSTAPILIKEGDRVPLITGNYGLYEEDAKWDNGEGEFNAIWDLDMGMYVPIELIDWGRMDKDPKSIVRKEV